eukprot:3823593-Heterocapsa_arctica.AAC.1
MEVMDDDLAELFAEQGLSLESLASIKTADTSLVRITDLARGATSEALAGSWAGELGVVGRVQTWRFVEAWSEARSRMGLAAHPLGEEAMKSAARLARKADSGGDLRGRLPSANGGNVSRGLLASPVPTLERGRSPGAVRTRPFEAQGTWSPDACAGAAEGPSA